ncbi:MAG: C-5 cytosine-specific DNA methylase [Lentisphaerae bacterium ADurb.Bin242]|nr:MAG: C-5 cytosine-specific DNA methylase [Lentisphaerae bacterium ADurb.Bin242]
MRGGDTPPGRTKRQGLASGAESGIDSAKSIRMRCGKPGGGKGALIGDNLSHTLATGNDQTIICLPKEQECFDIRQVEIHEKEIAPTLIATDYKGGKAISFYPQRKAESMVPLEECSNTLVNGTCPGHQNAVCFENHGNDSRIKESPGVSPTITSRAGTGGGNLPLVMRDEEPIGFIKNDAGGEQQGYWTGAFPTIRSQVIPAVAIAENVIGRQVENGGNGIGAKEEVAYTQNCTGVMGVCQNATVRRLLPVECERLMGFSENHTRIPWKGRPESECPDAPRYKACGNSMCVNVMAWIGQRIQHMEDISVRSSVFSKKE